MDIDWIALVRVAGVSLAFGAGVVVLFSVGLLGLSRAERSEDGVAVAGEAGSGSKAGVTSGRASGLALAYACFGICAVAVLFGIWLIVPQFH